ncbi:MAG: glycosyltransferase family 2 protein [Chitinophagaceae bacterium]|nr:MAG: glycosyltransferase family 2 protein [Chitinophagaceae bacterium]
MSTTPRVSVIIPTYNYAHFLDDAIQSVLAQTYTDYELIIVDNASTDNTDEVVARYLSDKRIRYYKHPENIGLVANWNSGLSHSRGEFLKMLCADDKFRPTLIEKYVSLMDRYPALSMVACNKQVFGKEYNYEVNLTLSHYQTGRDVNIYCVTLLLGEYKINRVIPFLLLERIFRAQENQQRRKIHLVTNNVDHSIVSKIIRFNKRLCFVILVFAFVTVYYCSLVLLFKFLNIALLAYVSISLPEMEREIVRIGITHLTCNFAGGINVCNHIYRFAGVALRRKIYLN